MGFDSITLTGTRASTAHASSISTAPLFVNHSQTAVYSHVRTAMPAGNGTQPYNVFPATFDSSSATGTVSQDLEHNFCLFFLPLSHSAPWLPRFPLEFRGKVNHEETRVMGLSYSEDPMIVA